MNQDSPEVKSACKIFKKAVAQLKKRLICFPPRAGKMLPKYFDKITLSKLLIDKLGGLGIVYDTVAGTREDAEE